jgi:hypothetical protein
MHLNHILVRLALVVALFTLASGARAQGTAFTYQGRLNDAGAPANGIYDLEFRIFDAVSGGAGQVGGALTNTATPVSNGLFTVVLEFGAGIFNGANRWLQIGVRTNGGGSFAALNQRQAFSATPYAIMAGNVSGVISNSALPFAPVFPGTVTAGSFVGNGVGVTNVNAASLGGASAAGFWQLGGNNVGAGNFLGSTNNQAVEMKVNRLRALRLENNGDSADDFNTMPDGAPNLIAGSPINFVGAGVVGATIAGGGATNYNEFAYTNSVLGDFGVISGGIGNTIGPHAVGGFIGGGDENGIGLNSVYSVIGGGGRNTIASEAGYATIAGGGYNYIGTNSEWSALGGGIDLAIHLRSPASTIAGGEANTIGTNSSHSSIGGGYQNHISDNSRYSTIAGGYHHDIGTNSIYGVIGGGENNNLADNSRYSTIAGGSRNNIDMFTHGGTIGGGSQNNIANDAYHATIAGGYDNDIGVSSGSSAVAGGYENKIGETSSFAFIGGGRFNAIGRLAYYNAIVCGFSNSITSDTWRATIAGGAGNAIGTNSDDSVISGGYYNTITANARYATIAGGDNNTATNYGFAAGRRAKAINSGAFVWADSQNADFASTANNQAIVRAAGGVGINTNNPGATLDVNGSLRVGFGTTIFNSLQGGVAQMATASSTVRTNFTFTFPRAFTTPPKVLLTARNEPAQANAADTFAVSVRAVTTTTCTVNIARVDITAGWGQLVMVDWLAWE